MELEILQSQLKSQILEHQVLVKQIKSDPQNPELQKRLKVLQNNITSLSEEQNRVVNQLRQELLKSQPNQQHEYDGKNGHTGKLAKVTIKQEPMDHINDVKHVVVKNVSVGTQNLPNLKPRPSPVVIVSTQGSPSFLCKSPSSPFNVKSPNNISVHNNNLIGKEKMTCSTARSSGNYNSLNLPTLLPKPPILIPNELPKKENVMPMDPKKLEFMAALGLITPQAMIEIQAKRQERKRRNNCVSPYSSLLMEPEPKKMGRVMMLPVKRGRGKSRPPKYSSSAPCSPKTISPTPNGLQDPSPSANKKMRYRRFISEDSPADEVGVKWHPVAGHDVIDNDDDHEDACAICKTNGELLMCDTCNLVYHLNCLDPPLTAVPSGMWICPKCKVSASDCDTMPWPGMLSVVRSYMAHKTAKEDEKNYLIKRSQELQAEKMELEIKAKRLSQSIMEQMQTKSELSSSNRKAKSSVDKLIQFIELVQSL